MKKIEKLGIKLRIDTVTAVINKLDELIESHNALIDKVEALEKGNCEHDRIESINGRYICQLCNKDIL